MFEYDENGYAIAYRPERILSNDPEIMAAVEQKMIEWTNGMGREMATRTAKRQMIGREWDSQTISTIARRR